MLPGKSWVEVKCLGSKKNSKMGDFLSAHTSACGHTHKRGLVGLSWCELVGNNNDNSSNRFI